jgi:hypothetical protein
VYLSHNYVELKEILLRKNTHELTSHNSHIWLCGTFNLGKLGKWLNKTKNKQHQKCKQLLDISHDHALEQMVIKP